MSLVKSRFLPLHRSRDGGAVALAEHGLVRAELGVAAERVEHARVEARLDERARRRHEGEGGAEELHHSSRGGRDATGGFMMPLTMSTCLQILVLSLED